MKGMGPPLCCGSSPLGRLTFLRPPRRPTRPPPRGARGCPGQPSWPGRTDGRTSSAVSPIGSHCYAPRQSRALAFTFAACRRLRRVAAGCVALRQVAAGCSRLRQVAAGSQIAPSSGLQVEPQGRRAAAASARAGRPVTPSCRRRLVRRALARRLLGAARPPACLDGPEAIVVKPPIRLPLREVRIEMLPRRRDGRARFFHARLLHRGAPRQLPARRLLTPRAAP